jgi:hypothetical protein
LKNQIGGARGADGGGVRCAPGGGGKLEGKRPLGRPKRRWDDNIKLIFRKLEGMMETGWSWLRIGTGGGHL